MECPSDEGASPMTKVLLPKTKYDSLPSILVVERHCRILLPPHLIYSEVERNQLLIYQTRICLMSSSQEPITSRREVNMEDACIKSRPTKNSALKALLTKARLVNTPWKPNLMTTGAL